MPIILLHGENQTVLKNRLSQIKEGFSGELTPVDGKTVTEELLIQNLSSGSLFQEAQKLIIIDNFSANKSFPEKPIIPNDTVQIVLTEEKKVSASQMKIFVKIFQNVKEEEFKIDPIVFKFLESLEPNNSPTILKLWNEYKKTEVAEIILVMLARQIRLLLLAKSDNSQISLDWARLSPWQQQKLIGQSDKFSELKLKELFNSLAVLDYKSKTGQLTLDLHNSLELFLLSL